MATFMQLGLALGLASAAGMRAYFPLIVMGLLSRFSDTITYKPPFSIFQSFPVLILLIILAVYEIGGIKVAEPELSLPVPILLLRALSGAILFAGFFTGFGILLGLIFGGILAILSAILTAQMAIKSDDRIFRQTNYALSILEDIFSVTATIFALLIPWASYLIWGLLLFAYVSRRSGKHDKTESRLKIWR